MPKKNKSINSVKNIIRSDSKRKKKNRKQYSFIPILLMLALVSFFLFQMYRLNIVKPINSIDTKAGTHLFVQREGVSSTLVVIESNEPFRIQGAWYIVENKRNGTGFVYYIPPGVYMKEYLNRVSEYVSTGDLKYVGDSFSQKRSVEYAVWQLGNLTGITPDSYIWVTYDSLLAFSSLYGDISDYSKDKYIDIYKNDEILTGQSYTINSFFEKIKYTNMFLSLEQYTQLIQNIDTNLSNVQLLLKLKNIQSFLATKGIYMLDLGQPFATTKVLSSNGKEIDVINYPEIDKRLGDVVKDLKGREIEREQVKIEIYNASEISGLAARYFRKFENAGIEVVRYENAPNVFDVTTIYITNQEKYNDSFELIKKLLVLDVNIVGGRPNFMTTGDIVIILGKDMKEEALWQ